MHSYLTQGLRYRAAVLLALVYGLCVISPSLALAFAGGSAATHCLTEAHPRSHASAHTHVALHVQTDVAAHALANAHTPISDGKTRGSHHTGGCCGLFCHVAVGNEQNRVDIERTLLVAAVLSALDDKPSGRKPNQLIRPPDGSFVA